MKVLENGLEDLFAPLGTQSLIDPAPKAEPEIVPTRSNQAEPIQTNTCSKPEIAQTRQNQATQINRSPNPVPNQSPPTEFPRQGCNTLKRPQKNKLLQHAFAFFQAKKDELRTQQRLE
jgi:hypothetical protein